MWAPILPTSMLSRAHGDGQEPTGWPPRAGDSDTGVCVPQAGMRQGASPGWGELMTASFLPTSQFPLEREMGFKATGSYIKSKKILGRGRTGAMKSIPHHPVLLISWVSLGAKLPPFPSLVPFPQEPCFSIWQVLPRLGFKGKIQGFPQSSGLSRPGGTMTWNAVRKSNSRRCLAGDNLRDFELRFSTPVSHFIVKTRCKGSSALSGIHWKAEG